LPVSIAGSGNAKKLLLLPSNLPDAGEQRPLQLLVVDDDATQRSLITVAAKQAGHEVTVAPSVSEAISQLRTGRFDYVTLDLVLEDGDGIEVLSAMSEAKFARCAIVISGMDGPRRSAARHFARSAGIELQSLPKPLDLAALRISLANLGKTAMALQMMHSWGGVTTDAIVERRCARPQPIKRGRRSAADPISADLTGSDSDSGAWSRPVCKRQAPRSPWRSAGSFSTKTPVEPGRSRASASVTAASIRRMLTSIFAIGERRSAAINGLLEMAAATSGSVPARFCMDILVPRSLGTTPLLVR
jgi:two-component system chemotaxis response regulator CheY